MKQWMLIIALSSSITAKAETKPTCAEALSSCDLALTRALDYSKHQDSLLEMQGKEIERLKKGPSLFWNPTTAFIAGMLVTGITVRLVK